MLLIVPVLAGILLLLNLAALQKPKPDDTFSIRKVILEALIILGVFLALSSEVLSLFRWFTRTGVTLVWCLMLLVNLVLTVVKQWYIPGWQRIRGIFTPFHFGDKVLLILTGIILLVTLITGILSPPNTNDSLLYHMPRVAHWIQSGTIAHHATAYINQLSYPIWAEEAIATFWILWGNDSLSFLVQWLSWLGCIVGVTYIVMLLGGRRRAQWLSAIFALSLPSAILQSSSTQTDLVTAFWYISLLAFLVIFLKRPLTRRELFFASGALAVGMLTKATFYLYAAVVVLALCWLALRHCGWKRGSVSLGLVALFCILVNAGYWGRNLATFGTPFGSEQLIASNVSGKLNAGFLLNPIRDLQLNLVTPSDPKNHMLFDWLFSKPGQPAGAFPDYWLVFAWNDEDYAGNPLHIILVFGTLLILLLRRKLVERTTWLYLGVVLLGCITLTFLLQYNPYFVRYELPFFIACAPLFGLALGAWFKKGWLVLLTAVLLTIAALPWLLINKTRPLVALRDYAEPLSLHANWITGKTAGSMLLEPRTTAFFARAQNLREPYLQMADRIRESGCMDIGLRIDSSDPEYPFWWVLSAPQSGYRLESLFVIPETERYLDPSFKPCAVICTICDGKQEMDGLKLSGLYENAYLYLDE